MADIVNAPAKDRADSARPESTRGGLYFTPGWTSSKRRTS
jgi:hypothetical protein